MSLERSCRLCSNSLEQPYLFFFECTAGGFPSLRSALVQVADAPLAAQFGRIVSGISTALLNEYEEDADGADEAAKAALLGACRWQHEGVPLVNAPPPLGCNLGGA
jgi:hypothetical protein